ncbi:hypothetical protein E4U43_000281 [Claviceps pusilla]|uniref:DUF4048 domain-containing protein n=1 Tax=Claviceps pusilla TaxID=123648 RepID=A0A9P7NC80_9HYPO|nr:hypothetical protein E4U43_000281 [Claviceps pusilla]
MKQWLNCRVSPGAFLPMNATPADTPVHLTNCPRHRPGSRACQTKPNKDARPETHKILVSDETSVDEARNTAPDCRPAGEARSGTGSSSSSWDQVQHRPRFLMTAIQLSTCALARCHAFFDQHRHRSHGQLANALSPRVAAAGASVRRRRRPHQHRHFGAASASSASSASSAPSAPFPPSAPSAPAAPSLSSPSSPSSPSPLLTRPSKAQDQHQRRPLYQYHGVRRSPSRIAKRRVPMSSLQEFRRRSSVADRTTVESSVFATTTTFVPPDRPWPPPPLRTAPESSNSNHNHNHNHKCDITTTTTTTLTATTTLPEAQTSTRPFSSHCDFRRMPPPPLPAEHDAASTRSSSSSARHAHSSSTSRIPNRLSLTLPIAPPTSDPSRPVPSSSSFASIPTPSSLPATPQDHHSAAPSLSNVNEFIIAIAAKERKVMEMKEELAREETELALLKKQFSSSDVLLKRGAVNQQELGGGGGGGGSSSGSGSSRIAAPPIAAEPDVPLPRPSVDVDRRTSTVALSHLNQGTPTPGRRRVMRGGHTRTLSLLSPAKSNLEFSGLDDQTTGDNARPSTTTTDRRLSQVSNPALPKRATWQPRSQQSSPVVPQIVEDLKIGLRAFVEDIRQITIGDEPVSGQYHQPMQRSSPHAGHYRSESLGQGASTDPGRSRSVQHQNASPASETPPMTSPPTPLSKRKDGAAIEKPKPAKSKHFSWTPLGFDSMDDTDWANWESPAPVKSTRWSGSTINSGIMDDTLGVSENAEEPAASTIKLEELFPTMVNRLSPSNIKRTANNLLDEWEKSLMGAPEAAVANKENTAV